MIVEGEKIDCVSKASSKQGPVVIVYVHVCVPTVLMCYSQVAAVWVSGYGGLFQEAAVFSTLYLQQYCDYLNMVRVCQSCLLILRLAAGL